MATFIDEEAPLSKPPINQQHVYFQRVVTIAWHTPRDDAGRYTLMFNYEVTEEDIATLRAYTSDQSGIASIEEGSTAYDIIVTCTGLDKDHEVLMWLQVHLQPHRPLTGMAQLHTDRGEVRASITLLGHFTDVDRLALLEVLAAREGIARASIKDSDKIEVVFTLTAPPELDALLTLGEVLDQSLASLTVIVDNGTLFPPQP